MVLREQPRYFGRYSIGNFVNAAQRAIRTSESSRRSAKLGFAGQTGHSHVRMVGGAARHQTNATASGIKLRHVFVFDARYGVSQSLA